MYVFFDHTSFAARASAEARKEKEQIYSSGLFFLLFFRFSVGHLVLWKSIAMKFLLFIQTKGRQRRRQKSRLVPQICGLRG